MKRLLILFLIPFQLVTAQNKISLDSCYLWARNNYPNLKQTELWQQIAELKQENFGTNYLPQVTINGQASYQSDVTEVPTIVPGFTIPTISKDQYKAYAQLHQNIWDGGISKANKALEDAVLQTNLSQLEVEVYELNQQVAQAFFTGLVVHQQKEVINAQIKTVNERLKLVESGVRNGVMEKSAILVLQAEILKLEQDLIKLDAAKNSALEMLSILTGVSLPEESSLVYKVGAAKYDSELLRPELQLFSDQQSQIGTQMDLMGNTRNPKVYGFGQLGYGKPGLNMLLDEFKGYYLFGVGVSWNVFDWKNTSRNKQVLKVQQEMVQYQEQTFLQNLEIILVQQKEQIQKIEKMLINDQKMVDIRTDITLAASSKLENETITASDYIQELQSETIAKLNYEVHKIQLNEAQEKYNLIKGKSQQTKN